MPFPKSKVAFLRETVPGGLVCDHHGTLILRKPGLEAKACHIPISLLTALSTFEQLMLVAMTYNVSQTYTDRVATMTNG